MKGFTLIELLAVLIILAIILLIAYPLISNIILNSRISAFEITAKMIVSTAEQECARDIVSSANSARTIEFTGGAMGAEKLNFSGEIPENGEVNITNSCEVELYIHDGKYCARKEFGESLVKIGEGSLSDCENNTIVWNNAPSFIPAPTFLSSYGGTNLDSFYSGARVVGPNYVAVGASMSTNGHLDSINKGGNDAILTKYNLTGSPILKVNYGGTLSDIFSSVVSLADGSVVAVGNAYSTNGDLTGLNKGSQDATIVKFDTSGNVVWKKNYGGSLSDEFHGIGVTSDNGFIAVGSSTSTTVDLVGLNKGGRDAIIVKYDSLGNVVWKKNYGGTSTDEFSFVREASDGGFIAVGYSTSSNGDLTGLSKGFDDAIIVKYDSLGNVVWKKNYGGGLSDTFDSFIFDGTDIIAVGTSNSSDGDLAGISKGVNDGIVVKYDSLGNVIWKKNYGGTLQDNINSIEIINNKYVLFGDSSSANGDFSGLNKGNSDAFMIVIDNTGTKELVKNYGGSGFESFYAVVKSDNNMFIALGESESTDSDRVGLSLGSMDAIAIEFDLTGTFGVKQSKMVTFGGTEYDTFGSILQDGTNYVMTGNSHSTNMNLVGLNKGANDGILVKYDASGNVIWNKNYGGTGYDYLLNSFNDGLGNYVVLGYTSSTNGDLTGISKGMYDWVFLKYDSSGNLIVNKTFGGTSSESMGTSIKTSTNQYVAVGSSSSTDLDLIGLNKGQSDAIIVKFDSSGNVIWKKNFGGTANEKFYSVIETSDGNYVALGNSSSTDLDLAGLNKGLDDGLAVKFDQNGNVVWKKTYGGTDDEWIYNAAATSDGGFLAGVNNYSTDGDFAGLTANNGGAVAFKADSSGNIVSKHNYDGTDYEEPTLVINTIDGYIVAVLSYSIDEEFTGGDANGSMYMYKYNTLGNLMWEKAYNGSGDEGFYGSYVENNDTIHIVGYSDSTDWLGTIRGSGDAIHFKIDASGNIK